jgi:hypothetical protein
MKALGKVMLCLGALFYAFVLGGVVKAHRMTGETLDVKHQILDECRARQAILADVDRSSWTDEQRHAFDDMCVMPAFIRNEYLASRAFAADAIFFLGLAILCYLGVVIVRALRGKEDKPR